MHYCARANSARCGYVFYADCTSATSTSTVFYVGWQSTGGTYWPSAPSPIGLTRRQMAEMSAATRALMAPRVTERTPIPVDAVNAGMALRRMRSSCGLARGRV